MKIAGVLGLLGLIVVVGAAVPAHAVSPRERDPGARAAETARCSTGSIRAVVNGRVSCLSAGGFCRARNQQAYRRYGFVCRNWRLAYDWGRLERPLRIPTLAPGSACPATQQSGTLGERGSDANQAPAFGPGPAYPGLGADATSGAMLTFVWPPAERPYLGWYGTKALWTIPRYTGAALVRGRQLDGNSGVGFDIGPGWSFRVHGALRLSGPESGLHPAATFVRAPGCYAYQVDVLHASYVIVFRAVLS